MQQMEAKYFVGGGDSISGDLLAGKHATGYEDEKCSLRKGKARAVQDNQTGRGLNYDTQTIIGRAQTHHGIWYGWSDAVPWHIIKADDRGDARRGSERVKGKSDADAKLFIALSLPSTPQ
jgi:hypothetical protein